MQNGRMRYEVLIGLIMLVVAFFCVLLLYSVVAGQIATLDLSRIETKGSMGNLALLLSLFSIATLFMGAIAGYLIGKYLHI